MIWIPVILLIIAVIVLFVTYIRLRNRTMRLDKRHNSVVKRVSDIENIIHELPPELLKLFTNISELKEIRKNING